MKLNEIPLIGGFYKDEDRDWSVQDCVNYLPTVAETAGTRTQTMLRTAPGLRPFVRVPGAGPCRGVYNCEGRLFAVLGDMLYLIGADQVAAPIGKIPGIQKVQFAHNQATSSGQNQLVIGNGSAGYIYNTSTKEFKRITDEGFIGGISPTFVDSYIVWVSSNRLYMLNSSVADAAEYNTLDQFQSEYSPDKLVCTIASSSELVAMSERSIEFFQNVGTNEQPFRSKGISIDLGAASRWGAVICDFSLFFLASDGTFRRIDNYNATRISTGPVEQAVRDLDWTQAQAYVWEEGRYKVVYWTFPDGYTFGWDIANGMWHRRVSYGLNRWRVSSTTRWNGKTIAGDFQRGDLWIVDSNYFLEGDQEYNCEITGPYIHGDGNLVKMPRMDIIMQTGQVDTVKSDFPDQPPPPSISGNPPSGQILIPYSYQFIVSGDFPPLLVSDQGASIPAGLSISQNGLLTGTPMQSFDGSISLRVEDMRGLYSVIDFPLSIKGLDHWNAADKSSIVLLTENDSVAQAVSEPNPNQPIGSVRAVQARTSGKYYVEMLAEVKGAVSCFGICTASAPLGEPVFNKPYSCGIDEGSRVAIGDGSTSTNTTSGLAFNSGSRVGLAIDLDLRRCWISVDGLWALGQSPESSPGLFDTNIPPGDLFPVFSTTSQRNIGESGRCRIFVESGTQLNRPSGFQAWGGI